MNTQVLIIGGGPGGLLTAAFLAKAGIDHLLIEKLKLPHTKACGDNLTGNMLRVMEDLFPGLVHELENKGHLYRIQSLQAFASEHAHVRLNFKESLDETGIATIYTATRGAVSQGLYQRALELGCKIKDGIGVSDVQVLPNKAKVILADGSSVHAEMVVFANGSNNSLHQNHFPRRNRVSDRNIALGMRGYFEGVSWERKNECQIFVDKRLMPGGLYLTPFKDGLTNVNITLRKDLLQKRKLNLKDEVNRILNANKSLQNRFSSAKQIGHWQGSQLQLATAKRSLASDRMILVGDAAGLIDILSANGLPQTAISAQIASKYIIEALKEQDFSAAFFRSYESELLKRIRSHVQLGRMLNRPFGFQPITNIIHSTFEYVAKKQNRIPEIEDMLYAPDARKLLIQPKFYHKIFFGPKTG